MIESTTITTILVALLAVTAILAAVKWYRTHKELKVLKRRLEPKRMASRLADEYERRAEADKETLTETEEPTDE